MDLWEIDLKDVKFYAEYRDNYGHIHSVVDVFSKYLHPIP